MEAASSRLPASTAMTALVRAYPSGPMADGLWLEGVPSSLSKKSGASGVASTAWSRCAQKDLRVMSLDSLEECMLFAVGIKILVDSVRLEVTAVGEKRETGGEVMSVRLSITETGQRMW